MILNQALPAEGAELKMLSKKLYLILFFLPFILTGCFSAGHAPRQSAYIAAGYDFINSGIRFLNNGGYEEAKIAFERAFDQFSLIDNSDGKIEALLYLIRVYNKTGEKEKTNAALLRIQTLGLNDQVKLLRAKAEAAFSEKDFQEVITLCQPVLATLKTAEFSEDALDIMSYYLSAGTALGLNTGSMLADYKNLLASGSAKYDAGLIENPLALSFGYYTLALAQYNMKDYGSAAQHFNVALEIDKKYENLPGLADDLYMTGKTFIKLKRFDEGLNHLERAADAYKALGKTGDYDHAMVDIMSLRPDKIDVSYLTDLLVNSKDEELKEKIRLILRPMK